MDNIERIRKMEEHFDLLAKEVEGGGELSQMAIDAANVLSEYLSSGDWLCDYELDSKHLLPRDLKRGVLSQDGLYDLLTRVGDKLR